MYRRLFALILILPLHAVAGGWGPSVVLSGGDGSTFESLDTRIDGNGDATAVWWRQKPYSTATAPSIEAARMVGGTWSAPVDLSGPTYAKNAPRLASGSGISAVATWRDYQDGFMQAVAFRGSAWDAPVNLTVAGLWIGESAVVSDGNDRFTAVWAELNTSTIQAARFDGGWGAPVIVSALPGMSSQRGIQIASDGRGNVTAVWQEYDGANTSVAAARRNGNGIWEAPVRLSTAGMEAVSPQIAVGSDGVAIAVWRQSSTYGLGVVQARRYEGGRWQAAANLSPAGKDASKPHVVADGAGRATVIWELETEYKTSDNVYLQGIIVVQAARYSGGWSAPTVLSAPDQVAAKSRVVVDGNGNVTALWVDREWGGQRITLQAARYNGTWSAPAILASQDDGQITPALAADAAGHVVVAWIGYDSQLDQVIRARRYGIDASLPAAPVIAEAVRGDHQITVNFSPGDLNGGTLTTYRAQCRSSTNSGFVNAATVPVVVTGLTNGTPYSCRVRTKNSVGWGPWSDFAPEVTPAGLPLAPPIGTAVAGHGQIAVNFTRGGMNGGILQTYRAQCRAPAGSQFVNDTADPIVVGGLIAGTSYTCRVRTRNDVGWGPWSDMSNAATPN